MITWMQKHKKWLVITIWISAIAFIGAGMVNWGSYGFGLNNDKVARVGDIDIRLPEYQRVYSRIFREYSQIPQLGGILDEAQAKQLGIPQVALQQIVQQAQIRNFARDLGLVVSDEEIGQEIIDANVYVDENGRFSQDIYRAALREMQLSTSEFEEDIRNMLLTRKMLDLMNIREDSVSLWSATRAEKNAIEMAYSINDRLMIKSIPATQVKVSIDESELKAFWELNADNWKTPMEFEIEYILVPFSERNPTQEALSEHYENFKSDYLDENGHLMSMEQSMDKLIHDVQKVEAESIAKREYRDLKNGNKSGIVRKFRENERFLIQNGLDLVVEDLKVAQEGQVLKPIEVDDGFVTLKILHKKESANQSFDEAKIEAEKMFKAQKIKETLLSLAKENLKNFSGIDIGFVSRFYPHTIPTLEESQKMRLLARVFDSQESEGYVLFDDKVVLYRVLEQSIKPLSQNQNANEIKLAAKGAKFQAISYALAEYLEKTYKTTIYIDVSK